MLKRLSAAVSGRALAWLLAVLPGSAASGPDFNVTEAAPGVFVHQGINVDLESPRRDDIANLAFVIGSRCVAVIDTGGSIATGTALREAIRARTDLPVCYVINTHVHFDHLLGNAAFAVDHPKFVGHEQLAAAVLENREYFAQNFAAELGPGGAEKVIGPDVTVADRMELDLGDRVLRLVAHPVAHTHQDLTVYDVTTRTLFAGDLVFMTRIPVLDGSLTGWLDVLKDLQGAEAARVVPGHGPPSADWPQAADPERRYLQNLLAEVRKALQDGLFVDRAMVTVGQSERGQWELFEHNHERNVSRAYRELEWESP